MENKDEKWITFPDGYSCTLKSVRTITKVQVTDYACSITIRFNGSEKCFYEWEFRYKDFVESKDELINKVEKLRERLVFLANGEQEPMRAVAFIDLKKKEIQE